MTPFAYVLTLKIITMEKNILPVFSENLLENKKKNNKHTHDNTHLFTNMLLTQHVTKNTENLYVVVYNLNLENIYRYDR